MATHEEDLSEISVANGFRQRLKVKYCERVKYPFLTPFWQPLCSSALCLHSAT